MINLDVTPDSNIVKAKIVGEMQAEDWDTAAPTIDQLINDYGNINLFLDATEFKGWDDLKAAKAHLSFVKNHHKKIDRVALVTGKNWQHWIAGAASVFVDAELKAFEDNQRNLAADWVQGNEQEVENISVKCHGDDNVLGIKINGKIRSEDYEKVLIPAMEDMIAEKSPISTLIDMSDFSGMEISAFWDDFKFGIKHMKDFKRIAIVGNKKWIERAAKLADPLTKVEIRSFLTTDMEEAWEWVAD